MSAILSMARSPLLRLTSLRRMSALMFCALAFGWSATAESRTLHWPALIVHMQIDEEGLLHITERHEMLFDGDWNGGERIFQWKSWQDLDLVSVSEILPDSGTRVDLAEGDLDAVNRYRLSGKSLRWRSRLPTDPPFENTLKVYEIVYTIEGALLAQEQPNVYRLEHDLAFPDRSGVIDRFEGTIDLDPAWEAPDIPRKIEREGLFPGQSVIVAAPMQYVGSRQPSAVASAPEAGSTTSHPLLRYASIAIVLALVVLFAIDWFRSEKALGRFEPAMPLDTVDEAWLADNVFNMKPEVVGSTWDRSTSSAEVAALIARLVQEGKLSSSVTQKSWGPFKADTLHLKLLKPRSTFESYERKLIDRLFIGNSTEIDTDALRAHYKNKGFDPAGVIDSPIRKLVPSVFKARSSFPAWRKWMTAGLLLTGIVLMAYSWIRSPDTAFQTAMSLIALGVLYVIGLVYAYIYSQQVHAVRKRAVRAFIVPTFIIIGFAWLLLSGSVPVVTLQLIALPVLVLGTLNSILNTMHCKQVPEGMQLRRQLGTARSYFERELASEHPRLRDEWFPYLLAFGLGPKVDRWFKAFGENSGTHSNVGSISTSSSSGGSTLGSSTWSGGGGTFGGAGASGSWASAVAGVAAGVAAPSSSGGSSGGGSSGGSSSSGGGGGGGW